jgi:pimeloyl-ACP methyl ester carboxylesterase
VNQAPIQVEVLAELSKAVKAGKITGSLGVPKKVVQVGHSFGAGITAQLLHTHPEVSDGAILTGASFKGFVEEFIWQSWQPRIANKKRPRRWQALDNGYCTWADIYDNVINFFKAPDFEVEVVKLAEKNKQPFAITEFLSLSLWEVENTFTGPVMVCSV